MKELKVAGCDLSWHEPQAIAETKSAIAIIIHVFYSEIWEELQAYLDGLRIQFDLFVTITEHTSESEILKISAHNPNIRIYRVENRGRDVLPFLRVVSLFGVNSYKSICKLHTKRTNGSDLGEVWRKLLYFDLIGSNRVVSEIAGMLECPDIGIITGKNALLDAEIYDFGNARRVQELAKKTNIEYRTSYLFPAGTMFWIKYDLLLPLITLFKDGELRFEKEMGQRDNTLAHAIERFFGLVCTQSGQKLIESPSKYSELDDAVLEKMSSLVLSQQYVDFATYTHALETIQQKDIYYQGKIEEKDIYIKELEALAQSLRIKNRIKRALPAYLLEGAEGFAGAIRNPAMFKKVFHHLKQGNFSYILTKTREKLGKNIRPKLQIDPISPEEIFEDFDIRKYTITENTIDIIIPVYNGYEYLGPLFDALKHNTTAPHRLIIINDCSPDPRVKPFLLERLGEHQGSLFLDHDQNQGFLRSVNEAVTHARGHFVILNTDTEVPKQWLERLMHPILTMENIASTTPFTNAGEIASFPNFIADNPIFEGMGVDALDSVFRGIDPQNFYQEMPTGVGFCMGINYNLVKKIGFFSEENFGKGYGEENDWCQRAIKSGYKNLLIPNLFVYHKHGGSFSSEEKRQLLEKNLLRLSELHPNYHQDVHNYIQKDPHRILRNLLIMLASSENDLGLTLLIDHALGGGANIYANELASSCQTEGRKVLRLTYDYYRGDYKLYFDSQEHHFAFSLASLASLRYLFEKIRLNEIFVNNLVSFKESYEFLQWIKELTLTNEASLTIPIHDYYPICPSYTLLDNLGEFCDIPQDLERCQACLHKSKLEWKTYFSDSADILKWRSVWGDLLKLSTTILTFSQASKDLLLKAYPRIDRQKIKLTPHRVEPLPKVAITSNPSKREIVVGVLGALNYAKGSEILKKLIQTIEKRGLDIKVVLIGEIADPIKSSHFKVTGRYKREELPELITQNEIDIFLIPSIWPETFSYTTQEIMMMEMPLMVFDLGAPAERVREYEKGIVLQKDYVENILLALKNFRDQG